ncbi:MAG: hypothetical protein GEU96_17745 [Propionibacteriales bacterium]|nr:hypothetical protein [Propionibacteriales bacterium]
MPTGLGRLETQTGISSSLTPGRPFDWAEFPLENTGESPATVRSVELVNGSIPAPVQLVEARALPAGRRPDGGVMKAGRDRLDWQVEEIAEDDCDGRVWKHDTSVKVD